MASDDMCPHGLPYYGNGTSDWGDCAVCFPRTAYWRAWQALRDFLNGTPEQWQKRCVDAFDQGYEDGFSDLHERIRND